MEYGCFRGAYPDTRETSILPMHQFLISVLCAAFLVSCNESKPVDVPEPDEVAAWPATMTTKGGSYSVTLAPVGGEILHNEHFSVELSVKSTKGDAEPFKVVVDGDMPGHGHGMNTKPELVEQGEGRYKVDGMLFHMEGDWEIMVDITGKGATERAAFPVLIE